MRHFTYECAADEPAVLVALAEPGTMPIAGGTELLNWMRLGVAAPSRLIDVGRLSGLHSIEADGPWLSVGALATLNEVGEHPLVREHAAVLRQACLKAASAQVRNRATLGGNVLQRTRCAYFRAEEPLPGPATSARRVAAVAPRTGSTPMAPSSVGRTTASPRSRRTP